MSAKIVLLKIKVFWKKGYDVIIFVHGVTDKVLSPYTNYNVNVGMWLKFGNSTISVREVIITSILTRIWPGKPLLKGGIGPSSIIRD